MKNNLLYFLPLLLAFVCGCTAKYVAPAPGIAPEGTYSGSFSLLHLSSKTGLVDTTTVNNLDLSMETATGFTVTGDTTTIHAGSYGNYQVTTSTSQIQFADKTWPLTGTPAKIHLDGTYNYTYNGTTLQMAAVDQADTLEYLYNFTKTGN